MSKKQIVEDMDTLFACYSEDTKKVILIELFDEIAHTLLVQMGCFTPAERKKLLNRAYKYVEKLDNSEVASFQKEEAYEWLLADVYHLCSLHLIQKRRDPTWGDYARFGRQYRKQIENGLSTDRKDIAYG